MARKPSMKVKRIAHDGKGQKSHNPAASRMEKPRERKTGSAHSPAHQTLAELDAKRAAFESYFEPYVPKIPEAAKRPVGKPPTYSPEFANQLIHYSALGHTIGAIAAVFGVERVTMNKWASSHEEFSEAFARGKGLRQFMYESHLIDIARRGGDSTRMSAIKLGLLNVGGEDWKERLTADHNVTFSLAGLIQESMKLAGPVIEGALIEQSKSDENDPQG